MKTPTPRTKKLLLIAVILAFLFFLDRSFDIFKVFYPATKLPKKKEKLEIVKYFSFTSPDSLKEWDEKVFKKKVSYTVETSNGESYIHALSENSCSAMYYKINLDVSRPVFLSWKWRVNRFPAKKNTDNLSSREEDDFAARIYVIFPALFFANSKVIEYIWAKDLESGASSSSPYSDNIKIMVVRSGESDGVWAAEERNIYKDYADLFKSKPNSKAGAIAIMCDSDSTLSSAESYFGGIKIFYKD